MPFTLVDLFSGIGGLSLGFQMAGFESLAGVEHNPHHQKAFKAIHPKASIAFNDVSTLTGKALLRETGLRKGELSTLVGGPPCQPFSMAGKRQGTADHRGKLIHHFVRLVDEMRPQSFVMENVVGLASIHGGNFLAGVLSDFARLGYTIADTPTILNAAHYGVPQFRRRVFLVGIRKGKQFEFPNKTHVDPNDRRQISFLDEIQNYVTVSDAICDLPSNGALPDSAEVEDDVALPYASSKATNPYQSQMRNGQRKVTGNQVSVHQPHILDMISLNNLPHGAEEPRTRYRRLYPDRPAFTLRAGSGTFTALRPIHPFRARVITVREAARLQSFPDYVNFSPIKKWAYQQIGNSVPPLLGKAIALRLADFLA